MPRRERDGEAARADAERSLSEGPEEITALWKFLPQSPAELKAERHTKKIDDAYFRAHPERESYVRPYRRGELPALMVLHSGDPAFVAVGFVAVGERVRVFLFPGMMHATGRYWAEQTAERQRVKLGMKGQA